MQEKLSKYDAPQKAKALGVYPYFRKIESDQDRGLNQRQKSFNVRFEQLFRSYQSPKN